jgi:hypothetical protein
MAEPLPSAVDGLSAFMRCFPGETRYTLPVSMKPLGEEQFDETHVA